MARDESPLPGALDLQHLRAHVGEDHGAEGPRHVLGQVQDPEPRQGSPRVALRVMSRSPVSGRRTGASSSRGTPGSRSGSPRCRSSGTRRPAPRPSAAAARPGRTRTACASARPAGAPSAILRATAYASSSTRSSGTTRFTKPIRSAAWASSRSPVSRISSVGPAPIARTTASSSSWLSTSPRRLMGTPNRLDSPQTLMSQSAASPKPPPTQRPSISADHRMPARADRLERRVPHAARTRAPSPPSSASPRTPRCRRPTRERPAARSPEHDAAEVGVAVAGLHDLPEPAGHRDRHRVELLGAVQDHRRDRPVPRHVDRLAHDVTPFGPDQDRPRPLPERVGQRRRPPGVDVQVHAELVQGRHEVARCAR